MICECEHGHRLRSEVSGSLVPEVFGERGLPVGGDGQQAPASPCREGDAAKEGRDRVFALVPGWLRGHRDRGVVGEHRDDGVDVGAFPGVDEMGNELTQSPIAECLQGRLLASCRESRVDGLVCASEGGVDRGGCHLERRRRLLGREPEHVSQDQHGALLCGDLLQGGDECELDAFALLVTGGALLIEQPWHSDPTPACATGCK